MRSLTRFAALSHCHSATTAAAIVVVIFAAVNFAIIVTITFVVTTVHYTLATQLKNKRDLKREQVIQALREAEIEKKWARQK